MLFRSLDHNLSRIGIERAKPGGAVNAQLIVEAWLGVELDGTAITSTAPGGLAAAAGLLKGDQLVGAGDTETADTASFLAALRALASEDKMLSVTILRGGGKQKVTLAKK